MRTEPSGGDARYEKRVRFTTPRVGLERDTQELVRLLKARVGPEFQGQEEESVMRSVWSLVMSFLFIFVALFIGFILFRWLMGGSGSSGPSAEMCTSISGYSCAASGGNRGSENADDQAFLQTSLASAWRASSDPQQPRK